MMGSRIVALAAVAALLSGCATPRARQELTRLQSQLGLLEERVTQLERAAIGTGFAAGSATDATVSPETAEAVRAPQPAAATAPTATKAVPVKPTTREIQQALQHAGFYQGPIDGKTGPLTRSAIKEFQRVHGLTDDGVVGKQTWAKLKAYVNLSTGSDELGAAEVLK